MVVPQRPKDAKISFSLTATRDSSKKRRSPEKAPTGYDSGSMKNDSLSQKNE